MIVTIDGPAGAGKSTVARKLAQRLGFRFLDTGAMYRAVALAAMRRQVAWTDAQQVAVLAASIEIKLEGDRVLLDGEDVTRDIRTSDVTTSVKFVADNMGVRRQLVHLQRMLACEGDVVTEGRDQGTLVFPEAQCKIFLTASPQERARRRQIDLAARGESLDLGDVLAAQSRRDQEDESREYGGLKPAEDAILVSTDGLSIDEVAARIEAEVLRVREQIDFAPPRSSAPLGLH